MATRFAAFEDNHRAFIGAQHIFFVATAAAGGRVNLSPKGMDSLRVAGPNRVLWLNVTGSGNETAGHLIQSNRMTLMWCGFETRPLILRAYGTARTVHRRDADWPALAAQLPHHLGQLGQPRDRGIGVRHGTGGLRRRSAARRAAPGRWC